MERREFLQKAAVITASAMLAPFLGAAPAQAGGIPAKLCNNCGFGNKADNCVKCGNWVGSTSFPAKLCNNCGFGNKADNCAKCGNWVGSTSYPAKLCNNCGFGSKGNNCVKCGNWVG